MNFLYRRIVIAVVGVVAAAYVFSVVVVTGKDLGVSDELYATVRDDYMRPHLMQSWGLFAKGIVNSDKTIVMRAQVQTPEGNVVTTGWVDIGEYEWQGILHNPTPARTARTTYKIAGDMQIAVRKVPTVVVPAISKDLLSDRPLSSGDYLKTLLDQPQLNSTSRSSVAAFVNLDNVATRLTTLYAYRFWNQPVVAVQWSVVISPVPRFGDRDTGAREVPTTVAASGWRKAPLFDAATISAWTTS
ncbi:hypothetical protein D1871_02720 [Nakamurella silvestris]|nr:hypothetical protein D1871_02720 [Nakamurella silvestris]